MAWRPALFDHAGVQPGTCSTCHNGVRATGKPTNHLVTSAECDSCHGTLAWKPARFDHSTITSGCAGCHNGTSATGKPTGHMQTARECSTCHKYPAWTPLVFKHTSGEYPGDHTGTNPNLRGAATPPIPTRRRGGRLPTGPTARVATRTSTNPIRTRSTAM